VTSALQTSRQLPPGGRHGTRSECMACGEVFCGVGPFDDHRVGEHGFNRHCLTVEEMAKKGLVKCSVGRWGTAPRTAAPSRTAETAKEATGADARERVAS
jgi:hypothetical protein